MMNEKISADDFDSHCRIFDIPLSDWILIQEKIKNKVTVYFESYSSQLMTEIFEIIHICINWLTYQESIYRFLWALTMSNATMWMHFCLLPVKFKDLFVLIIKIALMDYNSSFSLQSFHLFKELKTGLLHVKKVLTHLIQK